MSTVCTVDVARKSYGSPGASREILTGLRFELQQGEILTLLGPSGCGKTTLLRILAGLDTDYVGEVRYDGQVVTGPARDRALIFQEPRLLPWLTVGANIAFAIPDTVPARERAGHVDRALELVGLPDVHRLYPHQLSGGMATRVALARGLVNTPRILLLDEPFTGLDLRTKRLLHDQFFRIHKLRPETSAVLVTHDIEDAIYLSNRILILSPTHIHVLQQIPIALNGVRDRRSDAFRQTAAGIVDVVTAAWSSA